MKSLPILGTSLWAFFQLIQPIVLVNSPTHGLTRNFEDVADPLEMAAENERAVKRQRFGSDEQSDSISEPDRSAPDDHKFKDFPDYKPSQPNLAATDSTLAFPGLVQTEQNNLIRLPTLNTQTPQITSDMFEISRDHPYAGGLGPLPESFDVDKIAFFESKHADLNKLSDLTEWLPNFQRIKAKGNLNSGEDLNFLPVVMLPFRGGSSVVDDPINNLRVVNQNNFYQSYGKIKQLVGNLQNWLFSHHYRLSKRLGISDNARVQDQRDLHEWFRRGLFKPLHSLPVTGNVNRAAREKGFGLFQRWVIWYLYSEDLERNASITAVALNGLWWKDVAKFQWQMIMKENDCFWTFVSTHVPELDQKGPGVRFPPFEPKKPASQLPRLGMMDMKDLLLHNPFQFTNLIIKTPAPSKPILKLEKAIVDQIDKIYGPVEEVNQEGSTPSNAATRFFEMRAILEPAVEHSTNNLGFTIRLTDERAEKIPLETIEERLEDLLESFRWWHENLELGLLQAGIQPKPNAHQLFLKWFKSILYGKQNSLPVFGFIDLSDGRMISQGPPGFGMIQRFVIHRLATDPSVKIILGEGESASEVPASSATDEMAVLSHWYHLYFVHFWRDHLQNKTELIQFFKNGLASRNGLPSIARL